MIPPIIPIIININNIRREHKAAFSLFTPIATIIKTKEFSRSPIPPIEIGIIAMVDTTGTMNINAVRVKLIPRALAASHQLSITAN